MPVKWKKERVNELIDEQRQDNVWNVRENLLRIQQADDWRFVLKCKRGKSGWETENWRRNKWELQIALWVVFNLKASVMFKNCFKSKCKLLVKVNGRDWRWRSFLLIRAGMMAFFNILADNYWLGGSRFTIPWK